jgi:hydrogenase nickel incorporation protein HypB
MPKIVNIKRSILEKDELVADRIRKDLAARGVVMLNCIGSPGAGKTTLLEHTFSRLRLRAGVVEGDIATERDAERIRRSGILAVQINTKGLCHLEAQLVERALKELPLEDLDLVVVENVGNLVCPAEFDLGEDRKVAIASVPEGDDKPLKYPHLFTLSEVVILTKTDLLPYIPFDRNRFLEDVHSLNPKAAILEVCAPSGEGMNSWEELLSGWCHMKKRRSPS